MKTNLCEIIVRNVEGEEDSPPPPPPVLLGLIIRSTIAYLQYVPILIIFMQKILVIVLKEQVSFDAQVCK